jgi:hypothetical protein
MPATYRAPRPGDHLTVRTTDPYLDEVTVVIDTVADNGGFLLISGAWQDCELEVLVRRIGDHHPQQLE